MISIETLISICLGVGLAASAGFRVFVPLFILSLASHLLWIPVNDSWSWIGQTTALIALGIAMIFEILAYYIPFIDSVLDTIAIPLAAIAGTAVMASTLVDLSPLFTWGLAIIAGGGTDFKRELTKNGKNQDEKTSINFSSTFVQSSGVWAGQNEVGKRQRR